MIEDCKHKIKIIRQKLYHIVLPERPYLQSIPITEPLPAKAGRFELLLKQPKVVSAQGY